MSKFYKINNDFVIEALSVEDAENYCDEELISIQSIEEVSPTKDAIKSDELISNDIDTFRKRKTERALKIILRSFKHIYISDTEKEDLINFIINEKNKDKSGYLTYRDFFNLFYIRKFHPDVVYGGGINE